MKQLFTILILIFVVTSSVLAQIEEVIVEVYYISDSIDATDTIGGGLDPGSVTYRIYIDLSPGNKIKRIYGDEYHPLIFSSTERFFNNIDRGEIFGNIMRKNRLDENTVALDSWISIGFACDELMGILKTEDTDGSIIGGISNDGGSAEIPGGLLTNTNTGAGIPVGISDGLLPVTENTNTFTSIGFSEASIFGQSSLTQFTGNSTFLRAERSIVGSDTENRILIAQLTTKGDLSFKLNIEVEIQEGVYVSYIHSDTLLQEGEEYSNRLSFPSQCGCTDPFFIQYDPAAVCDDGSCKDSIPCGCKDPYFLEFNPEELCHDQSACRDSVILGCMDIYACNYDPKVNFNVQELCCYPPDNCGDRVVSIVCPDWTDNKKSAVPDINLFPNPVSDILTMEFSVSTATDAYYTIYDAYGNKVRQNIIGKIYEEYSEQIDLSKLPKGLYFIRITSGVNKMTKAIIKE